MRWLLQKLHAFSYLWPVELVEKRVLQMTFVDWSCTYMVKVLSWCNFKLTGKVLRHSFFFLVDVYIDIILTVSFAFSIRWEERWVSSQWVSVHYFYLFGYITIATTSFLFLLLGIHASFINQRKVICSLYAESLTSPPDSWYLPDSVIFLTNSVMRIAASVVPSVNEDVFWTSLSVKLLLLKLGDSIQ